MIALSFALIVLFFIIQFLRLLNFIATWTRSKAKKGRKQQIIEEHEGGDLSSEGNAPKTNAALIEKDI